VSRAERRAQRAVRRQSRRQQWANIRAAYSLARQHDKLLLPLLIGIPIVVIGGLVALGIVLGHPILFSIFGVIIGLLITAAVFGRRAGQAAYAEVEGRPGAAAGVLKALRGAWRVTDQPVAFTRNVDLVHRAVGRPGVVLIGEGAPPRVRQLLVQEKKRVSRVTPDVPIYDIVVGDGSGQVPLRKLRNHINKLPRAIKPAEVRDIDARLRALASGPPLPKGPMPQPGKMPKGIRGQLRG
jgi:hypothetical protein